MFLSWVSSAPKPPGLHTTAREPKRAHFRAPTFKNTTKIQREDPQEREERKKIMAGEGKKRAKCWAVRRRALPVGGGPGEGGPGEGGPGGGVRVGVVRVGVGVVRVEAVRGWSTEGVGAPKGGSPEGWGTEGGAPEGLG